jgi:DNA-binding transcriptional regulator YdaS (Cro superfamily)
MTTLKLKTWFRGIPVTDRPAVALKLGTSVGRINNLIYGQRRVPPDLAVAIERESGGAVKRQDLREDWASIWPELAQVAPRRRASRSAQTIDA